MCSLIIPCPAQERKGQTTEFPQTDLPCPHCQSACAFSSTDHRVRCQGCGWSHTLTDAEHSELVDAVLGISDLNLAAYLLVLSLDPQEVTV